jgi:hypothetical protein
VNVESFSTLFTSTLSANTLAVSSIQISTIECITATGNALTVSTLNVSTHSGAIIGGSTILTSTLTTNTINYSTLIAGTISLTTFITNQAVYGQTLKKTSMSVLRPFTIQSSDIKAEIDYPATLPQVYTFGSSVPNQWVATGRGTNSTIHYSNNGVNWNPAANNVFTGGTGFAIAWNGSRWVAGGDTGATSLAYSDDNGINWTAATSPSLTKVYSAIWTNQQWLAVGSGGGKWIIDSVDNGATWTDISTNISLTNCYEIAWNGSIFVAAGDGSGNTIIYSDPYSYTTWHTTTNPFSTLCHSVAWNGRMWVAVGIGSSAIAYSITDGSGNIILDGSGNMIWTNASSNLTDGYGVAWNGQIWVAGGVGGPFIVYSYDGITWINGIIINQPSITITKINNIAWNGSAWVATVNGSGRGYTAISYDGITWSISNSFVFSLSINKVAFNNRRPYTLTFPTNVSTATISSISTSYSFPLTISANKQLDVVSDAYYNTGYTNFSMVVRGQYS